MYLVTFQSCSRIFYNSTSFLQCSIKTISYDMFIFSISYKNSSYMLLLFICSYWIKIWSLMKLSARMNFMTVILVVWHTYIGRVARIHEIEQLTFKYIKSTFPLILIWDQFCNSNNSPKIWTNKKSKDVNVKNVIHWTTNIFTSSLIITPKYLSKN